MQPAATSLASAGPSPVRRWTLLLEVLLGAFIVIGHNVFHIVPNEVPILFVLFWISPRLLTGRWDLSSLRRPKSWWKTAAIALVASAVMLLGSELAVQPLAARIWHSSEQVSSVIKSSALDWKPAILSLALVWSFAAFGEELSYRGYLLSRAAELGNRSNLAYVLAMLYASVLFGFGHFYKGPTGVADSAYSGLVLGAVYLLTGRNLWAPILAHGITDTFAVLVTFLGWAN